MGNTKLVKRIYNHSCIYLNIKKLKFHAFKKTIGY